MEKYAGLVILADDIANLTTEEAPWGRVHQAAIEHLCGVHTAAHAQGFREGIEAAATQAEDYGHSNGRIRASHKHVAKAIRALKPEGK